MGQWLSDKQNTIYLVAENGERYAFYPRKSSSDSGYILVKDQFGKRRGVSGDRDGDKFITNPFCKNALATLTIEQLDEARGLSKLYDPPATELSPTHLRQTKRSSKDYSLEEITSMSESELEDYKRLVDSEMNT